MKDLFTLVPMVVDWAIANAVLLAILWSCFLTMYVFVLAWRLSRVRPLLQQAEYSHALMSECAVILEDAVLFYAHPQTWAISGDTAPILQDRGVCAQTALEQVQQICEGG